MTAEPSGVSPVESATREYRLFHSLDDAVAAMLSA
jgi:hypothetical protein